VLSFTSLTQILAAIRATVELEGDYAGYWNATLSAGQSNVDHYADEFVSNISSNANVGLVVVISSLIVDIRVSA
jgi:hypothetical protein